MGATPRILSFGGISPRIAPTAFLQPSVTVVGDVVIGAETSLWYGVVLRGDVEPIRVGCRTNIQDLAVVHVTGGRGPCVIGDEVTVGHRAVVHGCEVRDRALIGSGAVVLDGAVIGAEAIVAAGAVVSPGTRVPARTLARGVPARVVRDLSDDEVTGLASSARGYVELSRRYQG